jgi:arginine utilization protein RocB
MNNIDWYNIVRELTEKLVGIQSVSPGKGEIAAAQEVLHLLQADKLATAYTECGLDALEADLYGRSNTYAFIRGQSPKTLILSGHFDTVDIQDYGELETLALNPTELVARYTELLPEAEQTSDFSDWMFGRGTVDMKSGLAIHIALMRHFAALAEQSPPPISLVMVATADEENESAGIIQAVKLLLRLREQHQLEYLGAINTDYTPAQYPGDPHKYVFSGSVGKLLPAFLCITPETHVGDPFTGLDANLLAAECIRHLSMNDKFCDTVPGQVVAPPVTLHATDLKGHYDVQLPFASYFYMNIMTLTTTPAQLLERLQSQLADVMAQLLQRIDETEKRWRHTRGELEKIAQSHPRQGDIITYAQLYAETVEKLGQERVEAELASEWQRWSEMLDKRERCLHLTYRLWKLSGRQGPAIILFYAPPYYPVVAPAPGALQNAVDTVVANHPEVELVQQPYYLYLSDISYLRLDQQEDLSALTTNMPIWQNETQTTQAGGYTLPLEKIQRLAIPTVLNWGVAGRGAHKRDEAVMMSYSFGTLPQLLYETIHNLGEYANG